MTAAGAIPPSYPDVGMQNVYCVESGGVSFIGDAIVPPRDLRRMGCTGCAAGCALLSLCSHYGSRGVSFPNEPVYKGKQA